MNFFDSLVKNHLEVKSNVLDIGFGTGKFLYRLHHKFNVTRLTGIELLSSNEIESCRSTNLQSLLSDKLINFIKQNFREDSKVNHYDFYTKYVEYELNDKPLSLSEFNSSFKRIYEREFRKDYFELASYDLIIASKIIHYENVKSPQEFISDCIDLLKSNGIIYISFPTNSGRRKVSKKEFLSIIEQSSKLNKLTLEEIHESTGKTSVIFVGSKV